MICAVAVVHFLEQVRCQALLFVSAPAPCGAVVFLCVSHMFLQNSKRNEKSRFAWIYAFAYVGKVYI